MTPIEPCEGCGTPTVLADNGRGWEEIRCCLIFGRECAMPRIPHTPDRCRELRAQQNPPPLRVER